MTFWLSFTLLTAGGVKALRERDRLWRRLQVWTLWWSRWHVHSVRCNAAVTRRRCCTSRLIRPDACFVCGGWMWTCFISCFWTSTSCWWWRLHTWWDTTQRLQQDVGCDPLCFCLCGFIRHQDIIRHYFEVTGMTEHLINKSECGSSSSF